MAGQDLPEQSREVSDGHLSLKEDKCPNQLSYSCSVFSSIKWGWHNNKPSHLLVQSYALDSCFL